MPHKKPTTISKGINKINLKEKFGLFKETWSPKIIEELHGVSLKVLKVKGEFEWHHHKLEDELFWIIKGQLVIHFRDMDIVLNEGELLKIPRMVEHKPEAKGEVELVLIEPSETINTGDVKSEKTVKGLERI